MKNNRLITFFLGISLCAVASAQTPANFVYLPGLYSANGPYNYRAPMVLNAGAWQGDFITFTATGNTTFALSLSQINPLPTSLPIWVDAVIPPGGAKLTISALNNDNQQSLSWTVSVPGPGTFLSTNAFPAIEPVSTATGELFEPALSPDLSLGGPLPLGFRRYYASLINANGISSKMGNNWMHNFEWVLVQAGPLVEVIRPGVKGLLFQQFGTGWQLTTREAVTYQLVSGANNTYQFLDPTSNYIYTFSGTATTIGLSKLQDRNGNTLTITTATGSAQVSDGLGRLLSFTYDANGRVIRVADQTGRSVSFAFTGSDLTQFTNANGKIESFTYSTTPTMNGLMTSHALPLGNKPFSQTWDASGRVATQFDSFGNTTTLTYTGSSTAFKDPLGAVNTHISQAFSELLSTTDPDGQTISVTYDSNGRRNSVTDRRGNKITVSYDTLSGNPAVITDATGNVTTYTWQTQTSGSFTFYVLSKIQYADGTSVSDTYDSKGNLLSATDQAGKVWKFTYNNRGQNLTETDPLGHVVKYAYNATTGTLASLTDAAGNVTTYAYDGMNRVTLATFADGSTHSTTYDALDHVLGSAHPSGSRDTYVFNANEALQTINNGSGAPSGMTYDTDEQLIKRTDPLGQTTSYGYNQLGLNNSVTTAAGEAFTRLFDSHHRPLSMLDPSGNGVTFGYDKEDGPASLTDALSRKVLFSTDTFGSVTELTTPLSEHYSMTFDKLHRATAVTDPSGIVSSTTFDVRRMPSSLTIGTLSTTLTHDDAGNLAAITDPNGNSWSFGIDSAGRATMLSDPLKRSTTYSFDNRNRVSGIQYALGTVSFTRDHGGNVLKSVYSDGTSLDYAYMGSHLASAPGLTLSYDATHNITGSNGLVISRGSGGRILTITYAAGKTVTYGYNSNGLLGTMTDWLGGITTFTYNAAHELIAMKRPNGLGTQYTYDADGRLASITEDAGSSIAIQRDAAGKILSENRKQPQSPVFAAGTLPLTFDAADQISSFTYDALGRVTTDSWRTYNWDSASRLKSYSGVDGTATASYDGLGLRTSLTTSVGLRNFVWNYATSLPSLATVQDASGDNRYYIYTPAGGLLYAIDAASNAKHYYHFDQYGSTVLLTNDAGTVTDSYGITPYGETVTQNGPTPNPFTWLGQWGATQEGSTGLFYLRNRYYDSTTARFLSPDPVISANPRRINPYEYALANPTSYGDPTGLSPDNLGGPLQWDDSLPWWELQPWEKDAEGSQPCEGGIRFANLDIRAIAGFSDNRLALVALRQEGSVPHFQASGFFSSITDRRYPSSLLSSNPGGPWGPAGTVGAFLVPPNQAFDPDSSFKEILAQTSRGSFVRERDSRDSAYRHGLDPWSVFLTRKFTLNSKLNY